MTDFAIIGFGSRGTLFAGYIKENANMRLTAVVDVCEEQLVLAQKEYGVSADRCYRDYRDFYRAGKIADAVIVASQDADHYAHTIPALEAGYDVLLEKPVANRLEDCIGIRDKANALHRKVMVCHVLRYSHFYDFVKKIIDGGEIGRVININQTENVGYWHYAHSFIRGAWRNSDTSSPMILAKCCHDLDIITYLIGSDCESISSFGNLTYFKEENAPNGSAAYCFKCPLKDKCVFNCLKIYNDRNWMVLGSRSQLSADCMEELEEKLKDENNPFSRCVFRCDNNVVDHQEVEMLYKNGATAHLTMTPFSEECTRTLNVHGTAGEIEGDMEKR
ncbi:MAG: Gfo/Idh/MocA family protein [Christensenellaceae bacterium]